MTLVFVVGCGQSPQAAEKRIYTETAAETLMVQNDKEFFIEQSSPSPSPIPSFHPFAIYLDKGSRQNHFIPSGFMPDGRCITFNDRWVENCQSGKTCIRVIYDVACSAENQNWAGIYWLNPANNWGTQRGGYNLDGAIKLVFWARGDKGGERIEQFKIGGIMGEFPDTDMAMIGPVILTNEWREYSIDLRGKDLAYISGGFSWATNADVNEEDCVFYLDNIRFE
jgi:hypothetical protein